MPRQPRGSRRSRGIRFRRWVLRTLLAVAGLTVLPVLCLRWIAPPTSSVMLQQQIARFVRGEPRQPSRYLNIAQFGETTYGVAAAGQAFFGKRPNDLLIPEAALLAGVLPNPRRLDVRNPSAYVRERAAWIEQQMALLGGPAYLKPLSSRNVE